MAGDFFEILAEFGVHFGVTLIANAAEPECEVDRAALTNVVFDSALEQAYLIVKSLGVIRQLDVAQFGMIVGIIGASQLDMVEYLTSVKLSFERDLTRDVERSCNQAVMALRK